MSTTEKKQIPPRLNTFFDYIYIYIYLYTAAIIFNELDSPAMIQTKYGMEFWWEFHSTSTFVKF